MTLLRLLALIALVLCVAPNLAHAADFDDPAGEFHVSLDAEPGEQLCVGIPLGRFDPAACAGYEEAFFTDLVKKSVLAGSWVGMAIVHDASTELRFAIASEKPDGSPIDLATHGKRFADAMAKALTPAGTRVRSKSQILRRIADRDALQVDIEIASRGARWPEGGVYVRYFHLYAEDVPYGLLFAARAEDAAKVNALAERVLKTLRAKPPEIASTTGGDKRSRAEKTDSGPWPAWVIGVALAVIVVMLLAVTAAVLVLRSAPAEAAPAPGRRVVDVPPPPPRPSKPQAADDSEWWPKPPPKPPKSAATDDSEWWPKPPPDGGGT